MIKKLVFVLLLSCVSTSVFAQSEKNVLALTKLQDNYNAGNNAAIHEMLSESFQQKVSLAAMNQLLTTFQKNFGNFTSFIFSESQGGRDTFLGNFEKGQQNIAIYVDEDDKNLSQYNESRVSLQSTTQFLHDTAAGGYGLDVRQDGPKLAEEISPRSQVINGTALHLVVKGQSYLEPGDLIKFNLLSVDEKNPDGKQDPQYSGKYVITKIRHQVNDTKYTMAIEAAKDSTKRGFTTNDFQIEKNPNHPGYRNTYQKEEPDTPNRHG